MSSETASSTSTTTTTTTTTPATVASMSASWAQASELDLVFAMDATGSMGSYINAAKESIAKVIQDIVAAEKADVRFALVAYRDHPPEEQSYVTQVFDFTKSVSEMRRQLASISAQGGGDAPEAVADALHDVSKLDYRPNATKICMMISDAPPHGLMQSGDHFPNGCPLGLDPVQISHKLAEMGVTLYCVGCEPSINPYKSFFETLAFNTGGQYCALAGAQALSGLVVASAREEIHLERLMGDMDSMLADLPETANEEDKKAHLHRKMQERNVQVQHAVSSAKKPISSKARNMTKTSNMSELREAYSAMPEEHSGPSSSSSSEPVKSCVTRSASLSLRSKSKKESSSSSSSSSSAASGWFSSLFRRSAAEPAADVACDASAELEREECMDAVAAPCATASDMFAGVPADSSYTNKADMVSMEQCERLISKHAARKAK